MDTQAIDFAYGFFLYNLERFPYYSMISPIAPYAARFFFIPTAEMNMYGTDMLKPFDSIIWVLLILTMVLVSVVMHLILKWENQTPKKPESSTFVMTFGALCQQGVEVTSRRLSGRLLIIFLFSTSIIIYNYYTSMLVSSLVGSSLQTNIHDTISLADSSLEIGFENKTYFKGFLRVIFHEFYSCLNRLFSDHLISCRQQMIRSMFIWSRRKSTAQVIHRTLTTCRLRKDFVVSNVVILRITVKPLSDTHSFDKCLPHTKFVSSKKFHFARIATSALRSRNSHHFVIIWQHFGIGCVKLAFWKSTQTTGLYRDQRVCQMSCWPVSALTMLALSSRSFWVRTWFHCPFWRWKFRFIDTEKIDSKTSERHYWKSFDSKESRKSQNSE